MSWRAPARKPRIIPNLRDARMLATVVMVLAVVLLVFSSLLACLLSLLEWTEFAEVRRGVPDAGGDAAGFVMGQGYILIGAIAGALASATALLIHRPTRVWGASVLAVHVLVIIGVLITAELNDRLGRERVRNDSRLEVCPRCGARVRTDRLSKHINRVHDRPR
jgi:hypothetical protein